MELDDTVCFCFHVKKRKIINFIRVHRPRVASQISECGGAGTGCGWCRKYLQRYFRDSQPQSTSSYRTDAAETQGEAPEISLSEYARQRAEYISAGKGKPAAGAYSLPESSGDPES